MSATPVSALAAEVLEHRATSSLAPHPSSGNSNPVAATVATVEGEGGENQLSQDLALFLANPSLRTALADGSLDLKSYSATVRAELESLESDCIAVYRRLNHDDKITTALSHDINTCRTVLAKLHEMLLGFDADVGGLSGELRHWQTASRELDRQLRQGRAGADVLRHFLEHVVVAPSVAATIESGAVNNSAFTAAVIEIQRLYKNCTMSRVTEWSRGMVVTETQSAGTELIQLVTTLLHVAIKRSRAYLLQQMALLRRPQTNVRLIQVHGLLTHGAALYDFLEDCDETHKIAPELFAVYTESMSFTIKQLFRTYSQQLLLLDATRNACTRTDVLAIDEVVLRESVAAHQAALAAARQNRTTPLPLRVDPFALGQRAVDCIVSVTSSPPIAAHVAVLQKEQYPYERLWSSILSHLLDAVTNEHVFCRQFFKRDAFVQLFSGTLSLLTEQLENYLFTCYDALCLLLLIKVTHAVRSLARRRTITALDGFLEQVTRLVWPRLKTVMDAHVRSLRQATAVSLGLVTTSSIGSVSGGNSSSTVASSSSTLLSGGSSQPSVNAHYVSRRCGEFCCSILLILQDTTTTTQGQGQSSSDASSSNQVVVASDSNNPKRLTSPSPAKASPHKGSAAPASAEPADTVSNNNNNNNSISKHSQSSSGGGHDEAAQSAGGKLLQDVSEMMDAFVQLLERLAEEHGTQKKRTVFLINNLDHVVSVFQERRVTGKECSKLVELLMKYREDFVEEELLTGFSKMIAFVQQTEAHMASVRAAAAANATRGGGTGTNSGTGVVVVDYDVNPSVVEALVLDFASHWKSHIENINRNVLSYFSNFRNGMEILKHCLTQLLLYYTRFQDIIRKVWKKPASFSKDLVSTTVILAEIKKYALAI